MTEEEKAKLGDRGTGYEARLRALYMPGGGDGRGGFGFGNGKDADPSVALDNKFKVYPDTWMEGRDPDLGSATPEGAKFRPRRGFGWLWASNPDVRQTLGMGLTAEQGFTGSISGDGNATTVKADVTYVFNKDGTWALK